MRKRMWIASVVCGTALLLSGCGSAETPGSTETSTAPAPVDYETLLPKNTTGTTASVRDEGKLIAGETFTAVGKDLPEAGWIAQFACQSEGEVKAEVLVGDTVAVKETIIECGKSMPESLKFSGSGTITLHITGAASGVYVMQLVKDPAV